MSRTELKGWLTFDAALKHTKRSSATIKRAMSAGKISKKLVPRPGSRPQLHLWKEDLDRVFNGTVHVPAVSALEPIRPEVSLPAVRSLAELVPEPYPSEARNGFLMSDPVPVLDRLEAIFGRPEQDTVRQKLAWTLDEARMMTGLTEPALREMIAHNPALAIRQGRRIWIKAEALRKELS